jgi:hypothetical protein
MAPEQARGEVVDARADLFSLGVVLYRLLTKRLPFQGPTTMAVLTALAINCPETPQRLSSHVPRRLSDLVMRLLDKEPLRRPNDASTVVRLLAEAMQPERRPRWPIAVALLFLCSVLGGLYSFFKRPPMPARAPSEHVEHLMHHPPRTTDPDRLAAEQIAALGGVLEVEVAERVQRLQAKSDVLPASPFRLRLVDVNRLSGVNDAKLSTLRETQHLRFAYLSNTPITNTAVSYLKGNRDLTELRLHATKVTDAVYEHLLPLTGLRHLRIDQTSVSEATIRNIAQALPKCTIVWNGGIVPAVQTDGSMASSEGRNYALHFEECGEGALFPALKLPETGPLTMELYLALPTQDYEAERTIIGCRYQFQLTTLQGDRLSLFGKNHASDDRLPIGKIYTAAIAPEAYQPDHLYHVACVRTATEFRLYLDGKCVAHAPSATLPPGRFQLALKTRGIFDEIHISSVARYTADFTPRTRFTPDEHTLALYHCDEGADTTLVDSSKHARHAKIGNGRWKVVAASPK